MSSFNFSLSNAKNSTEKSLRLTQASSFFTSPTRNYVQLWKS